MESQGCICGELLQLLLYCETQYVSQAWLKSKILHSLVLVGTVVAFPCRRL